MSRNVVFLSAVAVIPWMIAASGRTWAADAVIRGQAGGSDIVITSSDRFAGAINSLTWNGREFIDTADHGRELQSASNLDVGSRFAPETFNPTEAGSRADGRGPTSTSRLLHRVTTANTLQTTTRMAFWLRPGDASAGHPAENTSALSDHLLTKRVQIGYPGLPHVITYDVTFSLPLGERHTFAQFEILTGYMPPEFGTFWKWDPAAGRFDPLSDGPGEQPLPVALSTADGRYAMAVYCPPRDGDDAPVGYGRFRFAAQRVNKWNCVSRLHDERRGIRAGEYAFRAFVIVGDLETVRRSLQQLHAEVGRRTTSGPAPATRPVR